MGTALYIRVSTEMQEKEGVSLETQQEQLRAYCKFKGLKNIREYVDVGSARTTNRPNFKKMMSDVKSKRISNVVVLKLDRLTRSIVDLNNLIKQLNDIDCALHSAIENIDTKTATGRMIINLIGTFAQWESETISERVTITMMTNAKKGIWQGTVPFGFKMGKDKKLKINEKEAKILREAFDMIKDGYSFTHTEQYISDKYNLKWRENYLRRKVRSESLIGNIKRNDEIIYDTHPAIISKKEQNELIKRLKENTSARTSTSNHDDLFRRKIKCTDCNHNLALSTSYQSKRGKRYYYKCNQCFNRKNKTISVSEENILNGLRFYFEKIELDNITIDEEKDTSALVDKLAEIESKKDRIQRAWIDNLMSDEDLKKYQNELEKERAEIEGELSKLETSATNEEIKNIVINMRVAFDHLTREEKRSFVQRFIKRIEFKRTLVEGYKKKYDYTVTNVEFY